MNYFVVLIEHCLTFFDFILFKDHIFNYVGTAEFFQIGTHRQLLVNYLNI